MICHNYTKLQLYLLTNTSHGSNKKEMYLLLFFLIITLLSYRIFTTKHTHIHTRKKEIKKYYYIIYLLLFRLQYTHRSIEYYG